MSDFNRLQSAFLLIDSSGYEVLFFCKKSLPSLPLIRAIKGYQVAIFRKYVDFATFSTIFFLILSKNPNPYKSQKKQAAYTVAEKVFFFSGEWETLRGSRGTSKKKAAPLLVGLIKNRKRVA